MRLLLILPMVCLFTACSTGKQSAGNNTGQASGGTTTVINNARTSGGRPAAGTAKSSESQMVRKEILETK
ncbi:MAG: hypothetical protein ACTHKV_02605 [Flavipsychrobacter sp.]